MINPSKAGIGIGTIAIIILTRHFIQLIPAMLVGMSAATLTVYLLGLQVANIGSKFGDSLSLDFLPLI